MVFMVDYINEGIRVPASGIDGYVLKGGEGKPPFAVPGTLELIKLFNGQ